MGEGGGGLMKKIAKKLETIYSWLKQVFFSRIASIGQAGHLAGFSEFLGTF